MPAVSILLPSYNHAEFLPACLESVCGQTVKDWELIAIDDGSSDISVRILGEFGDSRVNFLQNEQNLGTYGTLQRALSIASGDLVAVLNSDDEWAPSKLEQQVLLFSRHPEIDACYTAGTAFGRSDQSEHIHGNWPETETQELLPQLLEENRALASSVVFRRSTLKFNTTLRYSGDWECLLRSAMRGPLGFVGDKVTMWRIHNRNSFVRSKAQVAEEIRIRQSILARPEIWKVRNLPETSIRSGLSKCALHLSALLVLEGRMKDARMAARLGLSLHKSTQTLKRFAVVQLSSDIAKRKLWPDTERFDSSGDAPLIQFSSS